MAPALERFADLMTCFQHQSTFPNRFERPGIAQGRRLASRMIAVLNPVEMYPRRALCLSVASRPGRRVMSSQPLSYEHELT